MDKKTWEEKRKKKKIALQEKSGSGKKDYKKWAKYIVAAVSMIIFFFIFFRGKKEKMEIVGPETAKPVATVTPEKIETMTAPLPAVLPETPPLPKKNTPPEIIAIKLSPTIIYPGTKIKAAVSGKDADEDDEVTYFYEWRKNNTVLPDNIQPEVDTAGFKKGELISLFVTPFDGKDKGKTRFSKTIVIANRPPEITSLPPISIFNGKYIYEVKAHDPDGDALTYSLEDAPSGMTIDPATGVIHWDIPAAADAADLKSVPSYNIRIQVSDGDAAVLQGFSMTPEVKIK